MQIAYDFMPAIDQPWLNLDGAGGMSEAGERATTLPEGFNKPKYSYPRYSPERPSNIYPKIPEPYYTFSETFSY